MRKLITLIISFFLYVNVFAIDEWTIFPTSTHFRRGEVFGNNIYLISGNSLISVNKDQYSNLQQYNRLTGLNGSAIFDIIVSVQAQKLVVVYADGNIDIIDKDEKIINLPDYANKVVLGDRTIKNISERDGKVYIITGFGFIILNVERGEFEDTVYDDISNYKDGTYGIRTSSVSPEKLSELNSLVSVNGIGSSSNASLVYSNGTLLTSNTEADFRGSLFEYGGVISFLDTYEDKWTNIYADQIRQIFSDNTAWLQGITCMAIDPNDNKHFFVGTFALGLMEFYGEELVAYYNAFNCEGIETILPGKYTTRVGGIVCDENNYTWFTNVGVDNPLRCITPSGDFLSFPIKGYNKISNGFDKLIQTKNNPYKFKWILGIRPWQECQAGIYYDGGTPEDISDDESVSFSTLSDQDGNKYTPTYFNDIAEDKHGAIWLLTTSGPFVIDSQIEAFKNPGKVRRIKIPRNDGTNLADYLLAGVDCSCIIVDAANRKWIGTNEDGLYLLSADGLKQLEHFTTDNSPLLSNSILALAYDEISGTVYISCEGGVMSYVSDAVAGADNYSEVVCYPNPVRPEYLGPLHITGLKDNTEVRICDISNHVVYSTISEGGSITWELVDESGNRIKAGVYLVYGIDKNGHGGMVTKFLVIN